MFQEAKSLKVRKSLSKNRFDLHEERLTSTDEKGHRVYVHPEDVKGKWRTRRTYFYWFLIFLYLILPWTNWGGKQTILLDIVHSEFTFFGLTFYAHDAPIILLVLLIFLFTMGFITSLWGRAWCGWACPQTVFIDTIYRKIEQFVEGKSRKRAKLDEMPWNLEKITKRAVKWILFLIVSLHITHSFLGYFVGARELFWITLSPPAEHMTLFTIMLFITAVFLFDFGWFREQFCVIACPYGRIQSVMMDDSTYTVMYDKNRGEPHRGTVPKDQEGDCINCYHCVKVCPTGIDIRRGTQLECIACTQCIDACDEIMTKVNKPTGLIRYESENGMKAGVQKLLKPRSFIYLGVITVAITVLMFAISGSKDLSVTLIKGTRAPYKEMSNTSMILNLYKARLDYKGLENINIDFKIKESDIADKIEIFTPRKPLVLKGGTPKTAILHFKFPKDILKNGMRKVTLQLIDSKVIIEKEVNLVGPIR